MTSFQVTVRRITYRWVVSHRPAQPGVCRASVSLSSPGKEYSAAPGACPCQGLSEWAPLPLTSRTIAAAVAVQNREFRTTVDTRYRVLRMRGLMAYKMTTGWERCG